MIESVTAWQRPLVVGAGGQVGSMFRAALAARGAQAVLCSGRSSQPGRTVDLGTLHRLHDAEALLGPEDPDLIVCAGAMTFVDGCEAQPEQALQVNAYGPSVLAAYARERALPFVFFSSDYVFSGEPDHPGPYAEDAETRPLSVYGRSKLEGERAILRVYPRALVVRTSWIYGPDAAGRNFVTSLVRQLRAGQKVRVPADQISTPTLNRDLAETTLRLVRAGECGIFHVAGPELLSRLELAQRVARMFSLDGDLIEGVETAELGQRAKRPLQCGLISTRLPATGLGGCVRDLQEGLRETAASLAV